MKKELEQKKLDEVGEQIQEKFGMQDFKVEVTKIEKQQKQ